MLAALVTPEPWPEPVDGNELLIRVSGRYSHYLVLPPGAADVFALWTGHAHVPHAFAQSPRLNLNSSETGCGKTTSLDVLASLTPRPIRTENLTAPTLFRLVDQYQPTLLLDEVDTYLPQSEELRGLLNAGHKRSGCAFRCEGEGVRAFKAFGPAALAGIGPLPGTLHDRSICIPLVPAEEDDIPARFDEENIATETILCRQLARWTRDNLAAFQSCKPALPPTAANRLGDNWRPLFVIAQVAGGEWPQRVLTAFNYLTSPKAGSPSIKPGALMGCAPCATASPNSPLTSNAPETQSLLVTLLSDIRQVFAISDADRLSLSRLVESLCALPDRPWPQANRNSKPITETWLGHKLALLGINAHTIRIGKCTARGYNLKDFTHAFSRLLL